MAFVGFTSGEKPSPNHRVTVEDCETIHDLVRGSTDATICGSDSFIGERSMNATTAKMCYESSELLAFHPVDDGSRTVSPLLLEEEYTLFTLNQDDPDVPSMTSRTFKPVSTHDEGQSYAVHYEQKISSLVEDWLVRDGFTRIQKKKRHRGRLRRFPIPPREREQLDHELNEMIELFESPSYNVTSKRFNKKEQRKRPRGRPRKLPDPHMDSCRIKKEVTLFSHPDPDYCSDEELLDDELESLPPSPLGTPVERFMVGMKKEVLTAQYHSAISNEDYALADQYSQQILDLEKDEMVLLAEKSEPLSPPPEDDPTYVRMKRSCETARKILQTEGENDGELTYWVSVLESLIITAYHISQAESFTGIVVALLGLVKMVTKKCILAEVLSFIEDMVSNEKYENVPPDPHMLTGRDVIDGWTLVKGHKMWTRVSYLISAAMSMCVCESKGIDWSLGSFSFIKIPAMEKQIEAVDFIDAAIDTFVWVAETGWACFVEKSAMPLLYSDQRSRKISQEVSYLVAHANSFIIGNESDFAGFVVRLDKAIEMVVQCKRVKLEGPSAYWLQQNYERLIDIKERCDAKIKGRAVGEQSFNVCTQGPTRSGKTFLTMMAARTALVAYDEPWDKTRVLVHDNADKYQSKYTSDINVYVIDDYMSGKTQLAESNPGELLIRFFNNFKATAVKAELHEKGRVFMDFKVGMVTTNAYDLCVSETHNNPEAVLSRFNCFARVKVVDKYCKPGSCSIDPEHPELRGVDFKEDLWEITVEEAVAFTSKRGKESYFFRIKDVKMDDGTVLHCRDLNVKQYLEVIRILSREHVKSQRNLMKQNDTINTMEYCVSCQNFEVLCDCVKPEFVPKHVLPEPHMDLFQNIVDTAVSTAKKSVVNYVKGWLNPLFMWNYLLGFSPIKNYTTKQLANEVQEIINETAVPWIVEVTPECVFQTTLFRRLSEKWQKHAAYYDVWKRYRWMGFGIGALDLYCVCTGRWKTLASTSLAWWGTGVLAWNFHTQRMSLYKDAYQKRLDALPVAREEQVSKYIVGGTLVVGTIALGLKMFSVWNQMRKDAEAAADPHGIVQSKQTGWMDSVKGMFTSSKPSSSPASSTALTRHVLETLKKNQFRCQVVGENENGEKLEGNMNILFLEKSIGLLPMHSFYPKADMTLEPCRTITVTVFRSDKPGGKFVFKASLDCQTVNYPTLDLVAVFVPNCPDIKDASKWLCHSKPVGTQMSVIQYRDKDLSWKEDNVSVVCGTYGHKYRNFYGGKYISKNMPSGGCMSVVVLDCKTPCIVGVHIAGHLEKKEGYMQTLTLSEYEDLKSALKQQPGVYLSAGGGEIPPLICGQPVLKSELPHPHCMASRFTSEHCVEVLGSTHLRSTQKSKVRTSPISKDVEEVMGLPNLWGPPKLEPNWKGFNATLVHIANPPLPFDPARLEKVRQDYMGPLIPLLDEYVKANEVRPLTAKESILGIPGRRFIEPLKMATGGGFGLPGKKGKHFQDVVVNGVLVDRIPDNLIETERLRQISCWKNGKRAYPITTSTLKDEPTPVDSEKVRVFQAAMVSMSMNMRTYFLPIMAFLCDHPLESEVAVGVNCFSGDWEKLVNHACKYAADGKMIAWDYSKFDVRMNSQITRAVFATYLDLAKRCPLYSQEDLYIMEMMIADVVHPLLDYNGTLLMAFNMNTSGNNITVNINCTAGSLYVRLGFFSVYPKQTDFRKCVAAMTYGDDFMGSVHPDFRGFNFIVNKAFLQEHGMKITVPDKSDDECDFMLFQDIDFLKRKSTFVPEIGKSIGKLAEESISKSLHCNLLSKVETPREVSASCVAQALGEWFPYGREYYETRRSQLEQVCHNVGIPVPALHISYDDRVEMWKKDHEGE
nr:MAG: hypothetical protein 1 [Salisharnavirus sp.]